ncbi:Histidine protein kinase DivJ [Stieleria maiorica]|uniref:histidine kinase n=1 Tax=Stieleria maiorica TaxID=2795974 RepID=A0A5B9MFY7_9BACT|nr:HAMP domain-containing sensor histidine kinase [Stieleria maiorica]QEG00079.1 Histidine protein kinase DivJ [Stieleria maiorica]
MTSTFPMSAGTAMRDSRAVDDRGAPHEVATAARRLPGQTVGHRDGTIVPRRSAASDATDYETVSRLISETAHDLRAPLSTIREAIRLVRDGELGAVSSAQGECLSAAIDQCNCAVQLVDEMVQSRRFDSGFPNVTRQWISIDELKAGVEATLQPWILPRGIHLLWDGPFEEGLKVYADVTLLRRLIVNLAGNAIRVTREGGPVLIRTHVNRDRGVMNWSIVDQGAGISPADLELISAGKAPAKSMGGLGLIISRQLAAAHFSTLRIESRVGTGTAVSFQTIVGGPAAVAARWVKWRSDLITIQQRKVLNEDHRVHEVRPSRTANPSVALAPPRRVRIDVPSRMIEMGAGEVQPAFPDHVCLTTVSLGAAIPAASSDAFDALLQRSMRFTELAYRTGQRSWVIAWDADLQTGIAKRTELERQVHNEMEAMRMTWGAANVVPATPHPVYGTPLSSRLSDLIVRQTLAAAQQAVDDDDQTQATSDSMLASSAAATRLDFDVQWLRANR